MKKIMKQIKEIKQQIKQLKADYAAGYEVDGEIMMESEYLLYLEDLENELVELEGQL